MGVAKAKAKVALDNTKPKQDFNAIGQLGLKAQALAIANAAGIGTRLPAAFLTAFAADIALLVVEVPAKITTEGGVVQLTAAQSSALLAAYNVVKGIRATVKGEAAGDKDVLLAYGIGTKTNKYVVKEVTAAIQTILARLNAQPAEAAAFDITAADVTQLTTALAAIQAADAAQEAGRANAPQATQARNATARRILAGVRKIAGAGMRSFPSDPTLYASFERLITKKAG
jgi:hypothetical protein